MENLKELKQEYELKKKIIESRLKEFKKVPKQDYFYEACFCILTPQSNAKKCWQAIEQLKKLDFQNKNVELRNILKTNTRFHNNKSKYLIELKKKWKEIEASHKNIKDNQQLREFLTNNIKGYGLKEASHYLRNIGKENLAILDRHILKNLKQFQAIKEIPKSINKNKYYQLELQFKNFSKKVNIPLDHLDLLFWANENGEVFK